MVSDAYLQLKQLKAALNALHTSFVWTDSDFILGIISTADI